MLLCNSTVQTEEIKSYKSNQKQTIFNTTFINTGFTLEKNKTFRYETYQNYWRIIEIWNFPNDNWKSMHFK